MGPFEITDLRRNLLELHSGKDNFQLDPEYQRQGEVWNLEKKQLLIDTIINKFDIPKIYLHKFSRPLEKDGVIYHYAVIDGKQRLKAIWDFMDGEYALADDAKYLHDQNIKIAGQTYNELAKSPIVKSVFDATTPQIVLIETEDTELIEDLFSRLNEAVPLNAAEKRNAMGGPLPKVIRSVVKDPFFTECLPFSNTRYRHFDLAAKMLLMSHTYLNSQNNDPIADLKKRYLDQFVKSANQKLSSADVRAMKKATLDTLAVMRAVFSKNDSLLKNVGMISVFFALFLSSREKADVTNSLDRAAFVGFKNALEENRRIAEDDIGQANYEQLEFDRLAQSPNDGIALRYRLAVLDRDVTASRLGFVKHLT